MSQLPGVGSRFQSPDAPERKLRPIANVQLIAIVTLALSTLIAATAVSIGLARAEVRCMAAAKAPPFAPDQPSVPQPRR
jgi:putative Mn2+ efflux pump MntP